VSAHKEHHLTPEHLLRQPSRTNLLAQAFNQVIGRLEQLVGESRQTELRNLMVEHSLSHQSILAAPTTHLSMLT
jgi:hypothetical protein